MSTSVATYPTVTGEKIVLRLFRQWRRSKPSLNSSFRQMSGEQF